MLWRTLIVLGLVAIAAWTDLRERKLYNWNTYSGMLVGLAIHLLPGSPIAWTDSLAGWAACGGIMLLCFVLMPVGGGDVKLLAMMGAGLGLEDGLTALLWTCTLGAVLAAATTIWQVGAWNIVRGTMVRLGLLLTARGWVPWSLEQKQVLNQRFRLGPCALLAVILARSEVLRQSIGW
jgi:Flp pilus assembly protein protease CpaA